MKIAILITNPNHHLELTIGVAKAIREKGHSIKYVSLCEMRRMASPEETFRSEEIDYIKFGQLPEQLKPSSGKKSLGKSDSRVRWYVQQAFWLLKLKPFIKSAFKGVDRVLLLNDAAFPGDRICNWLNQKKIPFYLMQEGIRFPLPNETETPYGAGGAKKILCWGERSAAHFRNVVNPETKVAISGSPRFDKFLEQVSADNRPKNTSRVLGIFTNPIDDQGFCTKDEKLDLFERFIKRAADYINENEITLGIKCHPREDVDEYTGIASSYVRSWVVLPGNIMDAILDVDAGIIMASTVGLELLGALKPIAQLEIPNFGYVFDYTDDPGVVRIPLDGDLKLERLFVDKVDLTYFKEHVEDGGSVEKMYHYIIE